ncbi:hypothetical protein ARMSODRAFT_964101 [Armillaria solidipes]|uniref:Uncharacterized protein n=1 Tax=Armillaria solidipes TaxID=1076256 RepID=A0A2H3B0E1_9AGAR|nr:hypothetical protein ARMSODRAFT_964101 [Armillaria solidipes]
MAEKYKEEIGISEVSLRPPYTSPRCLIHRSAPLILKWLKKLLPVSDDASEQNKNENGQLENIIKDLTAKHETAAALALSIRATYNR